MTETHSYIYRISALNTTHTQFFRFVFPFYPGEGGEVETVNIGMVILEILKMSMPNENNVLSLVLSLSVSKMHKIKRLSYFYCEIKSIPVLQYI